MSSLSNKKRLELLEALAGERDPLRHDDKHDHDFDLARRVYYSLYVATRADASAQAIVDGQRIAALLVSDPPGWLVPLLRLVLLREVEAI